MRQLLSTDLGEENGIARRVNIPLIGSLINSSLFTFHKFIQDLEIIYS